MATKYELIREIKKLKTIIRKKCIECCCNNLNEAKLCPAEDCPLYASKQAIFHKKG